MKWYSYIICFVLIVVGTFCGIHLFKEVNSKSYINGSIDISNRFSQESFNYTSTGVTFYHDMYDETETYTFEKDLLKVDDYNGKDNTYQLWLNDFILLDTTYHAGSVFSVAQIDFYNEYGEIVNNSTLNISIKFLSNKTQLTLSAQGLEDASYLEQFFNDNGIRLELIQILNGGN